MRPVPYAAYLIGMLPFCFDCLNSCVVVNSASTAYSRCCSSLCFRQCLFGGAEQEIKTQAEFSCLEIFAAKPCRYVSRYMSYSYLQKARAPRGGSRNMIRKAIRRLKQPVKHVLSVLQREEDGQYATNEESTRAQLNTRISSIG